MMALQFAYWPMAQVENTCAIIGLSTAGASWEGARAELLFFIQERRKAQAVLSLQPKRQLSFFTCDIKVAPHWRGTKFRD